MSGGVAVIAGVIAFSGEIVAFSAAIVAFSGAIVTTVAGDSPWAAAVFSPLADELDSVWCVGGPAEHRRRQRGRRWIGRDRHETVVGHALSGASVATGMSRLTTVKDLPARTSRR